MVGITDKTLYLSKAQFFFDSATYRKRRSIVKPFVEYITKTVILLCVVSLTVYAHAASKKVKAAREELEYGTILFDYYQKDYFSALVEFEYAMAINNQTAKSGSGQVLKGGMLLSYGVADEAYDLFNHLLNANEPEPIRNRAWYYLAKLYHNKSDRTRAAESLGQVKGHVPEDIHLQYHYLATLININANHLGDAKSILDKVSQSTPFYPYLLFNMAIGYLRQGDLSSAVTNLERVAQYSGQSEELSILADRAKHGLAQLAIQAGHFPQAWLYLRGIRTTGLYSNRALLTYAWSAIKLKRFNDAIPALQILNERSIAIPEVQEAKVLLSHLYEQEGSPRKALKANLLAEKAFKKGMEEVAEARRIIGLRDVPREFIDNLEDIVADTDWYGARPTVNYHKLTPFLIDLMASHAFNETLKELGDLYAMHDNLTYWSRQAEQHQLILESAKKKSFTRDLQKNFEKSIALRNSLSEQSEELRLYTLTLEVEDQKRFKALLDTTSQELTLLDDRIIQLQNVDAPYEPPKGYDKVVREHHQRIRLQLKEIERYIAVLEPIMRKLVNAELDKHEERMRYYWAQSRLAKARLYDTTLLNLEKARMENADETNEESP